MSRRSKELTKHTFVLLFIDAIETNFYENLNPKRIKEYLVRKARRQQLNDQMGPLKLTVSDDHLELTRSLWWPDGTSCYLPYTQLRDVFPLELDGKKFVLGVSNGRTRQRRVLIFKARNVRECEQLVNTLSSYRQFQQTYESEMQRSTSRLEYDSRQSVKVDSGTHPYPRPSSAVSFLRSPSITNRSQPSPQAEPRRSRYQSMERVSFAEARDSLHRHQENSQRLLQWANPYSEGQHTKSRAPRAYRTLVNRTTDEYQRSASAAPPETYKILFPRSASRPLKMERSVMHYAQPRPSPILPDYFIPSTLPRSNSTQTPLTASRNDAAELEVLSSTALRESVAQAAVREKSSKQQNSIHIHIQTSPSSTLESGNFSEAASQARGTSPTRPPEYESVVQTDRHNHTPEWHPGQQRSRSPVIIVHERDDEQNGTVDLVTLHRTENQLARFVQVPVSSRPHQGIRKCHSTEHTQIHQNGEQEYRLVDVPRETVVPVQTVSRGYTAKGLKEKHQQHHSQRVLTEIDIEPRQNRMDSHVLATSPKQLITYTGMQFSQDETDDSSVMDDSHSSNEPVPRVQLVPVDSAHIRLNNYALRKLDTAERTERGSRTLYAARKKYTTTATTR